MKILMTILAVISSYHAGQANEVIGSSFSPAVRNQYKTPWCYAMASRALLDQIICESTQSCSTQSPDVAIGGIVSAQVEQRKGSIAQFIVANEPESASWFSGGDQQLTLQEISRNGRVATGQCTREKDLFEFHQNSKSNSGFTLSMQLEIVFASFQQSLNGLSADQLQQNRAELAHKWLENYSKSIESKSVLFLEPALSNAKNFDEFVRMVLLPTECKDKSILLPSFRIVYYSETELSKIEERLDEGLKKKRLVSLSVCSSKLSSTVTEECGAHAVVVSQSRTRCSGTQCEKEYRFLDSSFFPKSVRNQDGSYWLPRDLVIKATQAHGLYIDKTLKRIHDNYDQAISASQSELKKSILAFETLVLNMKITNQKTVDDIYAQLVALREKTKKDLAFLTPQQRADFVKHNPSLAALFDDAAFEKTILEEKNKLADQLEEIRKNSEIELKKSKQLMEQLLDKTQINFATSTQNIMWLELGAGR